ncbi:MAG: universal stress protein [Actinomycetota bacterium]|nr:universal stress protein [Actinomycetota bacterium]
MTFSTIVVGVDGHEGGRDALALADRLQAVCGELVAVCAYVSEHVVGHGPQAHLESRTRDEVHAELDAELACAGVDAEPLVVPDASAARALHRAAQRHQAALIVVGAGYRGRVGRVVDGDVAASTLHHSPCPVLVAPPRYAQNPGPLATIGAAFDGSPESRAAVVVARDVAVALGATLRVLTVLEPPGAWTAYPSWEHESRQAPAVRAATRTSLDALVAALGPNVTAELLEGEPARALGRAALDIDLLVCGSRSHGPLARLLLGGTSGRLTRNAPCPVLVLASGISEHLVRDDPAWIAART